MLSFLKKGSCNRASGIPPPINFKRKMSATRRDGILRLRETGLTYAEIGRRFGISKERVRQIVKRIPTPQKPAFQVMLKVDDVAQLLGIHTNTVRRYSNNGLLKSYRIGPRGDRRFKQEDIDSFLKEAESGLPKGGQNDK